MKKKSIMFSAIVCISRSFVIMCFCWDFGIYMKTEDLKPWEITMYYRKKKGKWILSHQPTLSVCNDWMNPRFEPITGCACMD